jgi:hypothetical protein
VARLHEVSGHGLAHYAETDETYCAGHLCWLPCAAKN